MHTPPSNVSLILFPTQDFPSYRRPGTPLPCRYVVEKFPGIFATQRGSYYKIAPSTQILTSSTLAPSLPYPYDDTTPNPSTTTPKLPIIALVTDGYRFSRGRTNRKRHETHDSCSSIWPLASKIFTPTAVSLPTGMRPLRRHYSTTIRGNPSRRGALSRFVATGASRFVLCFLFFFEKFRHHPELLIGMRLVYALHILLARILTGIFRMEWSALSGTSYPLTQSVPI